MPAYTETLDVMNYIETALNANLNTLGLKKVYPGFVHLTGMWPVAVLEPQERVIERRDIGGGMTYTFTLNLYVCHAKLTVNSQTRTKEDMALVTSVTAFLNADKRLGGNLNGDGYVRREQYGTLQTPKLGYVKGTRIVWEGFSVV